MKPSITLKEHTSGSYAPRTYYNASQGITLAVAVDHTTAGERLTQKAAKDKIVKIDYAEDYVEAARKLYKLMKANNCHTLNVAGNGIYTYNKHGISQVDVNAYILSIISLVHQHHTITRIVSGGQTGADIAGLVAGMYLGIPCEGMWPRGFKMRFENKLDVNMDTKDIQDMLVRYVELIG